MDNQIGYKRGSAFALSGLADVLMHRGDLAQARQKAQDAANIRRDLGAQLNMAITQTQLANIALEDGRETESEGLIRPLLPSLKKKSSWTISRSQALLTSIMLKQGSSPTRRRPRTRHCVFPGKAGIGSAF